MRIERHKNFLSLEECSSLNLWVNEGIKNKWLDNGISKGVSQYTERVTNRFYSKRFQYPEFVLNISNRIRNFCGINSYPLIKEHGRDGVVVSCTFPGGDVYAHKDPKSGFDSALRCNVMTRKPDSGGHLYIDDKHINIEVGELHCYLASDFEHYVTKVEGEISRVLWMFGAYVPKYDWENNMIKLEKYYEK